MLGRLLHPLDRQQQTLLLTLLSFGGSSGRELFALLPDDVALVMYDKAQALDEIPRDKRVPIMVRELKGLMAFRGLKGLDGVDPSWLSHGFKGESPRIIGIVLMHMPASVSRQIIKRLPEDVQRELPSRESLSHIPLEVIKLVRARFDAKFASMPMERELTTLRFRDIVALSAKELVMVVRHVGADELACAFTAVGKRAVAELLGKIAAEDAEEVMAALKRADQRDRMEVQAAQAFMAKVMGHFHSTDELFQKAGLYRLARAVSLEDATFVRQLSQRFPRAHGRLLGDYLLRVRELGAEKDAPPEGDTEQETQLRRLRDQVLDVVTNLSRRGKIDARFGQAQTQYETR